MNNNKKNTSDWRIQLIMSNIDNDVEDKVDHETNSNQVKLKIQHNKI